jgi:tetratricopeptide (TPR) repeat protein
VAVALARPFIGRHETLAAFRDRRDQVAAGHGAVSVLEGEAGVGKSTLLAIVLEESRRKGDRVLLARGHRAGTAPPFQLIREALKGSGVELPLLPDDLGAARSEERLTEMLRSLGDATEPVRARSFAPLAEPFVQSSREAPVVLALENIGDADTPSLEFLEYLAARIPSERIWLLLTCTAPGGLPEPARRLLEALPRLGPVDRWVLRPLAPSEVAEFVAWVDPARTIRPHELTLWYTQTGGNPLFLEQILRAERRSTPSLWDQARDSGVPFTDFVLARLGEIPEEERRTLSMAAVLGREFGFSLLTVALGTDEERIAECVERLVERGLLRESPPDLIEFSREDLRELAYGSLTEPLRRLLHQRAAAAFAQTGRSDPDAVFALAHHTYLAKQDADSIDYNRRAAEIAARAFSPEIARIHLERALEGHRRLGTRDRTEELEIVLELALALDRVGELGRAESLLREVLARGAPSPGAGPAAELLPVYLARILTDEGRWDEARHLTDELLSTPERTTHPTARLALHRLRGEIEYYRGEYDASRQYQDRALEIARAQGDRREAALVTVRRANALAMNPETVQEAIPAYREAYEELLSLGDRAEAAYALLFLGVTLSQHGRVREGLVELENAVELAEGSSDLRELAWALFNIADLRRDLGQFEVARRSNTRSRDILTRIGDRFGLAQTYIIAGKIALAEGRPDEAERELLEAFRLVRELKTEPDELEVLLRLGEVALLRGDRGLARQRAEELERRAIGRLRPDLLADQRRLADRIGAEEPSHVPTAA